MLHMPTPMLMGGGPSDPYLGADIVLDFAGVKNAGVPFYRVDGVVYASAAAAGFVGTGLFNSSGYTATGTEVIQRVVSLPGDSVILAEFQQPTVDAVHRYVYWAREDARPSLFRYATTGIYLAYPGTATSTSCTKVAFGRSGGLAKTSFNGAPVTTGVAIDAFGTKTLCIGNETSTNAGAWGKPIRMIAIYKQTLTDAQIIALAL